MADNVQITAGSGTSIATDDVGGVQYPRGKVGFGVDGSYVDVSASNPLPVTGPLTDAQLRASAVPISAAALPLPSGAATAAAQATGNASLASLDGKVAACNTGAIAGTVAISGAVAVTGTFYQATQPVSAASLPLPSGAATAAKQPALGTAGTAASDVLTVQGIASMTALKVDGSGATQPVSGTFWQATQPVSAASLPLPAGASTEATLAALNAKVTAVNTGAVTVSAALPAGTNLIGAVSLRPETSGGLSTAKVISAASTNATSVKGSAGQLYGYAAFNTHASSWRYLKLYDKASAPTVGTDTPVLVIGLPPGGGANLAFPNGVAFASGIALALTTGVADADTGAVGSGEVAANLTFK